MNDRIIYKLELNQYFLAFLPPEVTIYSEFFLQYINKHHIDIQTVGFATELFNISRTHFKTDIIEHQFSEKLIDVRNKYLQIQVPQIKEDTDSNRTLNKIHLKVSRIDFHFKLFMVSINIALKFLNDTSLIIYKESNNNSVAELLFLERKVIALMNFNILNFVINSYFHKSLIKIDGVNKKLHYFSFKEKLGNFFSFFRQFFQ